ncbi:alpha/beta fold hydrolase [Micromonospora avicenniae]|uniref:Pimeloyl-ACP methyl ester carboxylesterase n=1 Tax=Micromonospora avicenniae TaxID=1198245 RepID=A0A1N6W3B7_9ACTN|nr:alpha/beta fold hydrolase [Micromonospora avicenniae]SIQ84574.1 Pimeloyl-ACP methyl ester carboxylesterase [Micromonospora avicenniae]
MTGIPTTGVFQLGSGLALTVREAGDGEPVLLLHGAAGPDSIDSLLAHFAVGRHVLAPTHPGWDGTIRPGGMTSVADLAAAYLDLLEQRGLRQATVVGVSFGGWVAAEMAVRDRDDRVGRLVLIDAIGPQIPGHRPAFPSNAPPENIAALRAYSRNTLEDPTLLDRARLIRIPRLLVWGEDDPVVSAEFGRRYADASPGARFVLIPGAGHLPMREAPEATFAAIDGFLAATAPGRT